MSDADLVRELRAAHAAVRERLLAERTADGFWIGELSSSALSTATATSALATVDRAGYAGLVEGGVAWLAAHQNADGGWGDTVDSPSHLATTMLCRAALVIAGADGRERACAERADEWITRQAGASAENRLAALRQLYGSDRTFSVPILTNCALAGMVEWSAIANLPFELARIPHRWLRLLRAHVVSYALPALIAIGQLLHQKHPTRVPLVRWIRNRSIEPTLGKLRAIQPATGGFIEAVPLTSFVVMSLAAAGRGDLAVTVHGCEFLAGAVRPDGSWPIDSNLSVWLTTQAVKALAAGPDEPPADLASTLAWIADRQHTAVHPFTHAAPGGWGWTHLAGGVPDADDTAGALLALGVAGPRTVGPTVSSGLAWLLELQNADGGWPAFCRGWGRLPFDRSSPDLTAHALRALNCWADRAGDASGQRRAIERGLGYFQATQRADGAWAPLWFGNQQASDHVNLVYGTARVLAAYRDLGYGGGCHGCPAAMNGTNAAHACGAGMALTRSTVAPAERGLEFLLLSQNADGGWGGAAGVRSSMEETAAAVDALSGWMNRPAVREAAMRGGRFLAEGIAGGVIDKPSPIGLYFTKLWYSERLYPILWSLEALGRVLRVIEVGPRPCSPAGG